MIFSRDGHHVLSIVKNYFTNIMHHVPKDPADNEECSVVCMQAPSQDFVQEGANLGRAQGSPYQK